MFSTCVNLHCVLHAWSSKCGQYPDLILWILREIILNVITNDYINHHVTLDCRNQVELLTEAIVLALQLESHRLISIANVFYIQYVMLALVLPEETRSLSIVITQTCLQICEPWCSYIFCQPENPERFIFSSKQCPTHFGTQFLNNQMKVLCRKCLCMLMLKTWISNIVLLPRPCDTLKHTVKFSYHMGFSILIMITAFLCQTMPVAMALLRDVQNLCPKDVLNFILDLIKYNDNRKNKVKTQIHTLFVL